MLDVSLNEFVNEWKPEAGFSLSYSGVDDGSVGGCLSSVIRLTSRIVKDEGW